MVSGVSYNTNESKITISGVPDKPGISATIFGILAKKNINVDMIVQNISQDGISANLTFTVQSNEIDIAKNLLEKNQLEIKINMYKKAPGNSDYAARLKEVYNEMGVEESEKRLSLRELNHNIGEIHRLLEHLKDTEIEDQDYGDLVFFN